MNLTDPTAAVLVARAEGLQRLRAARGAGAEAILNATYADILSLGVAAGGQTYLQTDGLIVLVFSRTERALEAALQVQERTSIRVAGLPPDLQTRWSIGLHTGEIPETDRQLLEDHSVFARRIAELASPGQIVASERVVHAIGRLDARWQDAGFATFGVFRTAVFRLDTDGEQQPRDRISTSEFSTGTTSDLAIAEIARQKPASAQYGMAAGRLTLIPQPMQAEPQDRAAVTVVKQMLVSEGERLVAEFSRSNTDFRVARVMSELQATLVGADNVVELGLRTSTAYAIVAGVSDELPTSLAVLAVSHLRHVEMYALQYPEWRRFVSNLTAVEIVEDDVNIVAQVADEVVATLTAHPELAEPEVPKSLAALRAAVSNPARAGKVMAFALLRALENLVAKTVEVGAEFIRQTVSKTSDRLSTAISRSVVVGLMTLALSTAINLGPVASRVADAAWLKSAVQMLKRELELVKKVPAAPLTPKPKNH